ncbi:MAG: hypothetical protein GX951_05820 [Mollicutes bacterium]|nr:hypothetical protein [Mollicutes bacterium]
MNKYDNVDENELASLICENDENIKNIIFEKYSYIIDILIKKYSYLISIFQIDEEEIRCEASYGFSDGINSYKDNKNTLLRTFLTICIERRIRKYINKFTTSKYKLLNETLSLNIVNEDSGTELINMISADNKFNPLDNLTSLETIQEIISIAKNNLSSLEYKVFILMINEMSYKEIAKKLNKSPKQIDNTIQRIKTKMRKLLEKDLDI